MFYIKFVLAKAYLTGIDIPSIYCYSHCVPYDNGERRQTEIFDKYRIVTCICEHPDSTVWLAEHKYLNQERIIKGIRLDSPLHNELINEARILKNLKHPCIPEIYDLEKDNNYTYIIEQYIPGDSLKTYCKDKLLSEKEIFQFIIQISSIIDYLHSLPEKVLYLDIKPENIILYNNTCFLVDFGSARPSNETGSVSFGSPGYAAPEQFTEVGPVVGSDIYALGKLLIYMITHGYISSKQETALRKIAEMCLKPKFWSRLRTVRDFIDRIEELQKKTVCHNVSPLKLAVTGITENVGTTFVALSLGINLAVSQGHCAYVETADSEIWNILKSDTNLTNIKGFKLISCKDYDNNSLPDYSLVIDFGLLCNEMPPAFHEADCVCIVVGNMAWERNDILRARALSLKCKNIIFLVNLSDNITNDTANLLKGEKFAAIPYIRDFSDIVSQSHLKEVFAGVISQCRKD